MGQANAVGPMLIEGSFFSSLRLSFSFNFMFVVLLHICFNPSFISVISNKMFVFVNSQDCHHCENVRSSAAAVASVSMYGLYIMCTCHHSSWF